jgi:ABC-type antimicrobial peptide transport system permease subunit
MYSPASQFRAAHTRLGYSLIPLSWSMGSGAGSAAGLTAEIGRAIQAIDGQMPIAHVRTMDQVLSSETARQNFNMLLLSIFAGISLLLAAIGIYVLMSYSLEQQTQELGIRMALGADRPDLLQLALRQGMTPAGLGIGAGLVIAFGTARLLSSLLYGVKPTDPLTFAIVSAVLIAIALVSTYIPARRVMKLDPVNALRNE